MHLRVYNVPFHTHYLIHVYIISLWAKMGLLLLCTHLGSTGWRMGNWATRPSSHPPPCMQFSLTIWATSISFIPYSPYSIKNVHLAFLSLTLMLNLVLSYTIVHSTVESSLRVGIFVSFIHCSVLNIENMACNGCSRNIYWINKWIVSHSLARSPYLDSNSWWWNRDSTFISLVPQCPCLGAKELEYQQCSLCELTHTYV